MATTPSPVKPAADRGFALSGTGTAADPVVGFATIQLVALLFLQKIAVPGSAGAVSILVPIYYAGIGVMVWQGRGRMSLARMLAFALFLAVALAGVIGNALTYSSASLMLLVVLYLPFLIVWDVSRDAYLLILRRFQAMMLVGAAAVFVQLAFEVAAGAGRTLSLETLVPKSLLMAGYIYEAPIRFGSAFVRPNGFFFLEPSFVSLFLACAVLTEAAFFRRLRWLAIYVGAMLACMAATGPLMLVIAAPFVFARLSPLHRLLIAGAGVVAFAALFAGGVLDPFLARFGELDDPNTSGSARLVKPLAPLIAAIEDPANFISGVGPGNAPVFSWPVSQVMIEYGLLAGLLYLGFTVLCIAPAPNRGLAAGLFLIFHLTGGYLHSPFFLLPMMLLCSNLLPRDGSPRRRAALS